jgi:hypothetical protein
LAILYSLSLCGGSGGSSKGRNGSATTAPAFPQFLDAPRLGGFATGRSGNKFTIGYQEPMSSLSFLPNAHDVYHIQLPSYRPKGSVNMLTSRTT